MANVLLVFGIVAFGAANLALGFVAGAYAARAEIEAARNKHLGQLAERFAPLFVAPTPDTSDLGQTINDYGGTLQ